jgi:hypothetical protein
MVLKIFVILVKKKPIMHSKLRQIENDVKQFFFMFLQFSWRESPCFVMRAVYFFQLFHEQLGFILTLLKQDIIKTWYKLTDISIFTYNKDFRASED